MTAPSSGPTAVPNAAVTDDASLVRWNAYAAKLADAAEQTARYWFSRAEYAQNHLTASRRYVDGLYLMGRLHAAAAAALRENPRVVHKTNAEDFARVLTPRGGSLAAEMRSDNQTAAKDR